MDFEILDKLVHHQSRYALVIRIARLARAIVERDEEQEGLIRKDIKPVTVALERIASGEVAFHRRQTPDV